MAEEKLNEHRDSLCGLLHEVDWSLLESIADTLCSAASRGRKILLCGNGGSAAMAQHVASELVNGFVGYDLCRPAIALTADSSVLTSVANDRGFLVSFSRQIRALGQPGDVLWVFSTSGRSENIIESVGVFSDLDFGKVVCFLGGRENLRRESVLCDPRCMKLHVESYRSDRVQEVHLFCAHVVCELLAQSSRDQTITST